MCLPGFATTAPAVDDEAEHPGILSHEDFLNVWKAESLRLCSFAGR